ncbi:MAG: hypothetical protein VX015_02820, partial [Planctomycetota bacterium]|nr:hypothetical protein [Planctomycetota bacterium]
MEQRVPFALISLRLSWLVFLLAFGWFAISIVNALKGVHGGSDTELVSGFVGLTGAVVAAMFMIFAAFAGVL